nr:hypothetical protein [Tanacetum cinerariifolium]
MIAWERIDNIKYVLTEPEEIPELMYKLREDDEEYTIQYREYFEKSPDAVTTVLPIEEPEYSLNIGYKHPNITPKMESDEIIKSGVEELVPIPNEYEVTSEDKRECDVPVSENSPIFNDHSEFFSDSNNDDISSDDDAFEDIDINRLIANIKSLNDNPTPDCVLKSSASFPIFEESDNSFSDNFSPELKTFSDQTRGIENFGDDSKWDIRFLEELLIDDSIPFPNNELLDFEDDLLFPRPPPKPPDDEFGFEPN